VRWAIQTTGQVALFAYKNVVSFFFFLMFGHFHFVVIVVVCLVLPVSPSLSVCVWSWNYSCWEMTGRFRLCSKQYHILENIFYSANSCGAACLYYLPTLNHRRSVVGPSYIYIIKMLLLYFRIFISKLVMVEVGESEKHHALSQGIIGKK